MTQAPPGKYRPIMSTEPTPLTIMFWPESAYGPTNQCIGLAAILRDRGHTIVFAAESSWAGKLAPFGFIEELVDLAEPAEGASEEDAGAFWTEFIAETAPEFHKPTIEQLGSFIQPTYQALIDGAKYCEPRLREIIARHRPDVIVEDNVVLFPALLTSGAPFVRIVSCSPLEVTGPDVPPPFSGLPSADRSQWDALPHRVRPNAPHDVVRLQRLGAGAGRRSAARIGVHAAHDGGQPVRLPGRGRLPRRPPARRHLGQDGLERARDRRGIPASRRRRRPARRQCARLPFAGFTRRGRRRTHAAPGRRAGHDSASLYRQQGTAGRSDHVGGQHDRCADAAADQGDPAGRPGDLARREQHGHRDAALRQAVDRASAVLGSVRKCPADRRTRVRRSAGHL